MKRLLYIAILLCLPALADIPSIGWIDVDVPAPDAGIDDHTFTWNLDVYTLPVEATATWDTSANGYGRVTKSDGTTELASDWGDNLDHIAETGQVYILFTGTWSAGVTVRVWLPDSSRTQYAAGDTYGQYAAYRADIEGFWPDGAGNDRTGNALHLSGTDITPGDSVGQIGFATEYNGSTSRADVASNTDLPVTIMTWAKYDASPSTGVTGSFADKDFTDSQSLYWDNASNQVRCRTFVSSAFDSSISLADPTVWHHQAGVWTSVLQRQVFLNGTSGTPLIIERDVENIDRFTSGVTADSTPFGFLDGLLSDLRFLSAVVSDEELAEIVEQGADNGSYYTLTWVPVAGGSGLLLLEGLFVR